MGKRKRFFIRPHKFGYTQVDWAQIPEFLRTINFRPEILLDNRNGLEDLQKAWEKTVSFLNNSFNIKIDESPEVIVVSSGGERFDFDLYNSIRSIEFTHDNKKLCVAASDIGIKIFDTHSWELIGPRINPPITETYLSVSHDDKYLAISGFPGDTHIYNLENGEYLTSNEGYQPRFSPVKNEILSKRGSDGLVFHNLETTGRYYLGDLFTDPVYKAYFNFDC